VLTCIYPKMCPQPMKEEYLLSGYLEPTNEAYALAKIAGLKMCQYYNKQYGTKYISVMPTNLYGPNDNFDLENSHVLSALIRKMHEAKIENKPFVEIWGTGKPRREFLYVDDMADACVYLMETYNEDEFVNVGTGKDLTIKELSEMIKEIVGYEGELLFESTKPDGTPKKLLDVSKLEAMGWRYGIELYDGIKMTYEWYVKRIKD
ncbi:MAG: GDP-L-fucose synthase, partial [Actinobacteria bacterium]|nr:GDP-L-fucose synthase [Actinomycetota bacterium]